MKRTALYVPIPLVLASLASLGFVGLSSASPKDPPKDPPAKPVQNQQQRLAEIQRRLRELGPSPKERLERIALKKDERARLLKDIHDLAYVQQQGSAELIRRNRRDRLIDRWGIKATPYLIEALPKDRYWSARVSAQALGILAMGTDGDEVRWIAFHMDAPHKLIDMFGRGPDYEQPGLKKDLDRTLSVLSGKDYKTLKQWRLWWKKAGPKWAKRERRRDAERTRLRAERKRLLPEYEQDTPPPE